MRQKKGIHNYHIYIVLIAIIFSSHDTYVSFYDARYMYTNLFLGFGLVFLFALNRRKIHIRQVAIALGMCGIIILSMIANFDFSGYSMFVILSMALFFEEVYEFDDFYLAFDNIIYVASIISILVTMLWIINPAADYFIYKLVFVEVNYEVPWGLRLYGIFREPAMYCIYLGLALIRNLLFVEKKNIMKIIVYGIALILTGSTTGYIAIGFFLVGYYFFGKHTLRWKMGWIFVGIIAFLFAIRMGFVDYFIMRLATTGASAYSSNSRYYSITGGAIVGLLHPFVGAGAIKSESCFNEIIHRLYGESYCWANMITYLWASFGTIFIGLFLRGIYKVFSNRKGLIPVVTFITICLLLCGETMTYSSIMYIFMFYGYSIIPLEARSKNIKVVRAS